MAYILRSARFLAEETLRAAIQPGDTVIDATMGNGHDTLTLCHLVGENGRVIAFDVQAQAVENTRQRLTEAGVIDRAELYCLGHQHMREKAEKADAVVFNLGWLPGGDKSVTTHLDTTMDAVGQALDILRPMGVLLLCVYPGHAEGDRERAALTRYFAELPPQRFNVLHQQFINAGPGAPECFVIQKQPEKG